MSVQVAEQVASSPASGSWQILFVLGIILAVAAFAWFDCKDGRDRWKQGPGSKDTEDQK